MQPAGPILERDVMTTKLLLAAFAILGGVAVAFQGSTNQG